MTTLAPTIQAFFTDRLARQRQASPHTVAAYRDAVKLLLTFAQHRTGTPPSHLQVADLDAPLIGAFLDHLETGRGNSVRTRNARLAAVHSLFRYAALRHPEAAAVIQRVLAIPPKRCDHTIVTYLTDPEIDALLAAPDQNTWTGRRDHALLALAIQTGLRATELTSLKVADTHLGTGAHVSCLGKGRKQRITPLTAATVSLLATWLTEHAGLPADPLFPTRRGTPLSRDALERRVAKHATTAAQTHPTLASKKTTPHTLRHSAAMRLLNAGVDTTVIALWLGHENVATTQIYVHADLALKERALARTAPTATAQQRYLNRPGFGAASCLAKDADHGEEVPVGAA
jgi:site-specific recombinase XerD